MAVTTMPSHLPCLRGVARYFAEKPSIRPIIAALARYFLSHEISLSVAVLFALLLLYPTHVFTISCLYLLFITCSPF